MTQRVGAVEHAATESKKSPGAHDAVKLAKLPAGIVWVSTARVIRPSLKAVQELLGHASIQMTMRYAHLTPCARRGAVELLDADGADLVAQGERDQGESSPGDDSEKHE